MTEHRDNTRFKWIVGALVFLAALAMILGTIQELVK